MHCRISIKLRMECRNQHIGLSRSNHTPLMHGKHLYPIACRLYVRRTYKRHGNGSIAEVTLSMKTAQLTTVSITAGRDVHHAKMLRIKQYQACASAERRESATYGITQRLPHILVMQYARHRGTLSARDYQSLALKPCLRRIS